MEQSQEVELKITWHSEDQRQIFLSEKRFNVLRAGRRWGKTKGAFHRLVDLCISNQTKHLWVDTTQSNIEKYFDEHLEPLLPKGIYHWDKRKKVLKLANGSLVHFGSEQIPENLEGFGYNYIWLNETGKILKGESGRRLWFNTIRPMAMEHKAGVWFVGTPKGEGLFKEFSERGESDDPKWADWATFHRASFDRAGISQDEIDELIQETPGGKTSHIYRQEILAEFPDQDEGDPVIEYANAREACGREFDLDDTFKIIWGVDPSGEGADEAGLVKRRHNRLVEPSKIRPGKMNGPLGAEWLKGEFEATPDELRPDEIIFDGIGLGESWYSHSKLLGFSDCTLRMLDWSKSPLNGDKNYQRRDELWKKASDWIQTGSLCGDYALMNELVKPLWDLKHLEEKGKYKVESKEKMRSRLKRDGASPNRADAFVITMAAGIERKSTRPPRYSHVYRSAHSDTAWMGV